MHQKFIQLESWTRSCPAHQDQIQVLQAWIPEIQLLIQAWRRAFSCLSNDVKDMHHAGSLSRLDDWIVLHHPSWSPSLSWRMEGWMNGRMDGWMNGCMDG